MPTRHQSAGPQTARLLRRLLTLAIASASALVTACDHAFEPIQETEDAVFSLFGYLDLKADTQWIRVMPVRETMLLGPGPIDALVTLEHVGSGRTVMLTDSLFSFPARGVDGVAYVHNFWTAEPLEAGATYRLRAARSDGETTTATVVMPSDLEVDYLSGRGFGTDNALLRVRAEQVLFVDMFYSMIVDGTGQRAQSITVPLDEALPGEVPGTYRIPISGAELVREGLLDVFRREVRVAVSTSDWPFRPDLSDLEVLLPGRVPTNVENGFGFIGGVAEWTIPMHRCQLLEERPDGNEYCVNYFNARSASISGRVIRQPCGDAFTLRPIHLTERFAGGGAVIRTWATGWEGEYRFDGVEPGAELALDLGLDTPVVILPPLAPGERYVVDDIFVTGWC